MSLLPTGSWQHILAQAVGAPISCSALPGCWLMQFAAQVVCVTLSGAGDQRLGSTRFKIVILDEASQATEPSTLIPLVIGLVTAHMAPQPTSSWASHAIIAGSLHIMCICDYGRLICVQAGSRLRYCSIHHSFAAPANPANAGQPVQVRGAECVVIAGDPQQLPPTVSAPQAVAAQLDRTVFERLQVQMWGV